MSVWPAWEVQEHDGATSWFHVRLAFPDGARVDALAVVCEQTVSVEDVRAQPALSLDDLTLLADWLEGPLFEACGVEPAPVEGRSGRSRAERAGRGGLAAWHRGAMADRPGVPGRAGGGS